MIDREEMLESEIRLLQVQLEAQRKAAEHWERLCTEEPQDRFRALRTIDMLRQELRADSEDAAKYRALCK